MKIPSRILVGCLALLGLGLPQQAHAGYLGFNTSETSKYLLVGTGTRSTAFGVDVDNRRLVGDIAITHANGDIELSNVAVTGPRGIVTTQTTYGDVLNGISNSTFDGPGPNGPAAFSETNGISLNNKFNGLLSDLATAKTWIGAQTATQTFATNKFSGNTTITLQAGLNIIDLGVMGSDFLVENGTLNITQAAGVTDAVAIFRVKDKKFETSNAKILTDAGLGNHNVLFYSGVENQQAFNLSNIESVDVVGISGVAFWALGQNAEININNGKGCTQLIADKINLNNVDLQMCDGFGFGGGDLTPVPAPAGIVLLATAIPALGLRRILRRKTA